ncbi:MAG: hypothetical protein RIB98_00660 [Acidimicrobiales bacterium]
MSRRRIIGIVFVGVVAILFMLSSLNPLLAAGAINRLEQRCPEKLADTWTYDRSGITPLA